MTDPTLSTEQVQALLDKSRGNHWYFQTGWGIQYSLNGGLGLLVPDGHEGAATVAEMDLMAASQQIARQYVVVVSERDTAQQLANDWAREAKRANGHTTRVSNERGEMVERLRELAQDWRNEAAESRRVHGLARESYSQTAGVLESCADQLSSLLDLTPAEASA